MEERNPLGGEVSKLINWLCVVRIQKPRLLTDGVDSFEYSYKYQGKTAPFIYSKFYNIPTWLTTLEFKF